MTSSSGKGTFLSLYKTLCLIGFLLLGASQWLLGQTDASLFPPKPSPAVFVHDYVGWLTPSQRMTLENRLRAFNDSTSTQIVLMIRKDLGDYDKASYAFELGKRWGIGQRDKDNGIVMVIKSEPPDRGIFIATGYGTEGALPDILSGQIIRNTMAPYFRQQQYYEGIQAGLTDVMRALRGEFKAEAQQTDDASALFVLFALFVLLLLFVWIFRRRLANSTTTYTGGGRSMRRTAYPPHYPGGGGGWWIGGGSGGWSSGGGDGGGWSGGDFGGGDFGGGGAGGDW